MWIEETTLRVSGLERKDGCLERDSVQKAGKHNHLLSARRVVAPPVETPGDRRRGPKTSGIEKLEGEGNAGAGDSEETSRTA